MHCFKAGHVAGKQGWGCIGMSGSDPNSETGIMKMADNAAAEKSSAAKYGHAQSHDATVSRQLRLSYPYRHYDTFELPEVPDRTDSPSHFRPTAKETLRVWNTIR